jgi:hypothetical protein
MILYALNVTNSTTLENYTHTHHLVVNARQRLGHQSFWGRMRPKAASPTASSNHPLALLNHNNTMATDTSLLVSGMDVMALLV